MLKIILYISQHTYRWAFIPLHNPNQSLQLLGCFDSSSEGHPHSNSPCSSSHITSELHTDSLGVVRCSQDTPSLSSNASSLIGTSSCMQHKMSGSPSWSPSLCYMFRATRTTPQQISTPSPYQPTSRLLQTLGPTRHTKTIHTSNKDNHYPPLRPYWFSIEAEQHPR